MEKLRALVNILETSPLPLISNGAGHNERSELMADLNRGFAR